MAKVCRLFVFHSQKFEHVDYLVHIFLNKVRIADSLPVFFLDKWTQVADLTHLLTPDDLRLEIGFRESLSHLVGPHLFQAQKSFIVILEPTGEEIRKRRLGTFKEDRILSDHILHLDTGIDQIGKDISMTAALAHTVTEATESSAEELVRHGISEVSSLQDVLLVERKS